ncbi:18095_t:CDS:2 [Entrophospora sp. SA101]|nr:18095_t:CDS:2 [Entrophospora sp. SA101]
MQSKLFELVDFLDPILQYLANDKALYPTLYVNRFWYCIAGQILCKHIELDYMRQAKFIEICENLKPFHGSSGKIKSLKGELDLSQKESSKKESEISSFKSNLAELERIKEDLISKVSELEHLKLVTISRNLSNQVELPSGEAKLRTSDSSIIGGGDEGQSTIAPTIKNIANSDVISAVDKPKLNFSKFLKRRNNMDQTEKIDTPKSSDTIIKANILESTNVEFPTNASQASEMINFSGGAISEILPIRGGEL